MQTDSPPYILHKNEDVIGIFSFYLAEVEESEVIETPFMETMRSGGLVSRFFNQYEQRAQFDMLDIKMQIWDKTQLINIL